MMMLKNMFNKFKETMSKTRETMGHQMEYLFGYYDRINDDFLEELEEVLILSDFGFETTESIMNKLRNTINNDKLTNPDDLKPRLIEILTEKISFKKPLIDPKNPPKVILIIGVNGAGKTTSIGKIAYMLKNEGNDVVLAAADTFRAAAIEQLDVWAQRAGVDIVKHQQGSDPASVIFDGIAKARTKGADTLICDSAGRLHNKKNLMQELSKISRIIEREYDKEDVVTLLVLDSTTGQNALNQAMLFKESADIDGLILTKLDGSSKGGFVFAIKDKLDIPVVYITLGEKIEDIAPFDAESFARSIFE